MKILSIAVPCYNSEAYMEKCIDSLLVGGEEVEILIVDDGSKDGTTEIADRYQEKYPTIVKAIHQENKGHGGAVNTGVENATGLYFKVVDSDDWVNPEAYQKILNVLAEVVRGPKTLDLLISNYVYEKEGAKRKRVMRYAKSLPEGRFFGWDEAKALGKTHYLLMHSLIYRTSLLRECGMKLPEHTFYVDNLVAFIPLPYVKTMYYLDVNFYRYFIGRADQSVNEKVMIGRIDQQIRVNKLMIDYLGELSDHHYDGFFRDDDALRNGRKSREKERSVEIPETGGCSRLLPHPPRHFRNCYEQQIKTGTENCSLCLQGSAETVWI